jgi:hypothetical protein
MWQLLAMDADADTVVKRKFARSTNYGKTLRLMPALKIVVSLFLDEVFHM